MMRPLDLPGSSTCDSGKGQIVAETARRGITQTATANKIRDITAAQRKSGQLGKCGN